MRSQGTILCLSLLALPIIGSGADLAGSILNDKGKPVNGATVTVHRSTAIGLFNATESYLTTTAKDGSYAVNGLTAGTFVICANASANRLLDPCRWSTAPPSVDITNGPGTVSNVVQLQPGAVISIRVDDPHAVIAIAAPGTTSSQLPFLVMGAWTGQGHFYMTPQVSSDPNGYNYELVVEPDVDLEFAISVQNLVVNDDSGAIFDGDKRVHVRLAAGATLQLHYTLSKKP